MKKRKPILAACTAAAIVLGSCANAAAAAAAASLPFDDIAGSFAKNDILELVKEGVVNGTGNRKFEPKKRYARRICRHDGPFAQACARG